MFLKHFGLMRLLNWSSNLIWQSQMFSSGYQMKIGKLEKIRAINVGSSGVYSDAQSCSSDDD